MLKKIIFLLVMFCFELSCSELKRDRENDGIVWMQDEIRTSLYDAVDKGDVEGVAIFLKELEKEREKIAKLSEDKEIGVRINKQFSPYDIDSEGRTPLLLACQNPHNYEKDTVLCILQAMFHAGFPFDSCTKDGKSALDLNQDSDVEKKLRYYMTFDNTKFEKRNLANGRVVMKAYNDSLHGKYKNLRECLGIISGKSEEFVSFARSLFDPYALHKIERFLKKDH